MLVEGTALGPYRIVAPLGAGGMGEVYRARDTRLGRDVAIKVLSAQLAVTPEVRARFGREARTISQLKHPHICTLYDVGHQDGTDYLVMELLEGVTLERRLERDRLPADDVLALGSQIADALERAHRAGIVHRDLKPGNIMLTKTGAKLMDFGLAHPARPPVAPGPRDESPTMIRPLTADGTILGTLEYMAPEQLEGAEADARSDIWALGCVLYEMATGQVAFQGRSGASLVSAIMSSQPPPPTTLAPLTPPALERVIQNCLAKDPGERIQTAHDVKLELGWIAEGGARAGLPAAAAAGRPGRGRLAWTLAGVATLAAVVAVGALVLRRGERHGATRLDVRVPGGVTQVSWPRLSPDGGTLVFLGTDSTGIQQIWIRPLGAADPRPLQPVGPSSRPFWSPDGRHLAYFQDGWLWKIAVAGGPAVRVCEVRDAVDGTWGRSGWILYDGARGDVIRGIPASGGALKEFTSLDRSRGEIAHYWPSFLPDGRHFLFVAEKELEVREIRLGEIGSRDARAVGPVTESRAEYAPPGYIVYANGGALMAQRFSANSGRLAGDPVPIGEGVGGTRGHFSTSHAGVLAYRSARTSGEARLLWLGRDGGVLAEAAPPALYEDVVLSPDGTKIAVTIQGGRPGAGDIWVRDLARGVNSRLTFDPGTELAPAWSPDGSRLAFAKVRGTRMDPFIRPASGVGVEDSLPGPPGCWLAPYCWSAPANAILFALIDSTGGWDFYTMPADRSQPPRPFLAFPYREWAARLSPDGRWLAYVSEESGRNEVYVVPFPDAGGKWQVSTGGGSHPLWSADGKEIFFRGPDQSVMAVDVRTGATFQAGVPRLLFKIPLTAGRYPGYRMAVSPDGRRFLVNTPLGAATVERLIVVTNWTAELRRK
jgi:Tol biopolymer transport system component